MFCLSCDENNIAVQQPSDAYGKNVDRLFSSTYLMKELNIDILLGGLYTSKSQGADSYGLFRLLDFSSDAYHASLYIQEFEAPPTLEAVKDLTPLIGHAPIDTRALFNETELTLIGQKPLSKDDFEGYAIYLEHSGVTSDEIEALVRKLLQFATQPPHKVTLTLEDGKVLIEERSM